MTEFKLLAAVLILLAGVLGAVFANRLLAMRGSALLTRLANTFAGGIFLGAAFLHMLPEAREHFDELFPNSDYPIYTSSGRSVSWAYCSWTKS